MTRNAQIAISNIPAISAIYYALLQCGYDYYSFERSPEHNKAVQSYIGSQAAAAFFSHVKQDTCEVYPYWPRAAILETASFYLRPDMSQFSEYDAFHEFIMSAGNIADNEREQALWDWIKAFPQSLSAVLGSDGFRSYMEWEKQWIAQQNIEHEKELRLIRACLDVCVSKYGSPVQNIQIVINPIKCAYSADYHLNGGCFIFSAGMFRVESVIHEFLHHLIHPLVMEQKDMLFAENIVYPGLDDSYYLSGDKAGQLNAFEEYAVRELTNEIITMNFPDDLAACLKAKVFRFYADK